MKKKGFTLVELLAVIVIIAIVAVITIPLILKITSDSKKQAIKQSAIGYVDAIEKTIVKNKLKNNDVDYDGEYTISKTKITKNTETASLLPVLDLVQFNVKVKGEVPNTGNATIQNSEVKSGKFYYDNYLVTLTNGKYNVQILTNANGEDVNLSTLEARIEELEGKVATLESNNNYSTSEQLVGKWIDGKKLYKKTFTYGAIAANSWLKLGTISNMENGWIDTSASYFINANSDMAAVGAKIPVVVSGRNVSTSSYTVYTMVYKNGDVYTGFGKLAKASSMVVTVLYTKTTE